jgi:hypothetical protein
MDAESEVAVRVRSVVCCPPGVKDVDRSNAASSLAS